MKQNTTTQHQLPEIASVEIDFPTPQPSLDDVKWHIIVAKNGDRPRVIDNPDVEMLFPGENAGLLFSAYPTMEYIKNPDDLELTVRTAYVKRNSTKNVPDDWETFAQDVKASGIKMTVKILLRKDDVDTFLSAAAPVMARHGEWRIVELLLDDDEIGSYRSWGKGLYGFDLLIPDAWLQTPAAPGVS